MLDGFGTSTDSGGASAPSARARSSHFDGFSGLSMFSILLRGRRRSWLEVRRRKLGRPLILPFRRRPHSIRFFQPRRKTQSRPIVYDCTGTIRRITPTAYPRRSQHGHSTQINARLTARPNISKKSRSPATSSTASSCRRCSTRSRPAAGTFRISEITIGQARHDPSYAVIEVRADSAERLARILAQIADHGAVPTTTQDCRLVAADMDGAFPEGFYSTTNQRTEVRLGGDWVEVADQEMDCGVVVDATRTVGAVHPDDRRRARHADRPGARRRARAIRRIAARCGRSDFTFMSSGVSTEKPKGALIREIARDLVANQTRRRQDAAGRRAGDRPHRQRAARCAN